MSRAQLVEAVRDFRNLLAGRTPDLTDGQLLGLFVARRDEAAFDELVRRHGPMVLGVCRRVLRHEQDAEDACQAAFLVLARAAGSVRKHQSVASWLYGAAFRTAQNARRIAMRRQKRERRPAAQTCEPAAADAALRELQALLDEEVGLLPDRYRAPFVLCCLEGRGRAEAAVELGCKEGTVASRLARARELLGQRLARRGVTLPVALAALTLTPPAGAPSLWAATVRGALAFATGKEGASAGAAGLAREVLRGMTVNRLRTALAFVLALGLLTAGAGIAARQLAGAGQPDTKEEGPPAAAARPAPAKADRHGDPLPPGALLRLGTTRFRHGNAVSTLAYTPDGRKLVSVASGLPEGVCVWDASVGQKLRQVRGKNYQKIAVSPDGKAVAAAAWNEVQVFDPDTGQEKLSFAVDEGTELVGFSPDGKTLATWRIDHESDLAGPRSGKNVVTLHEAATGKLLRRLERVHDPAVVGDIHRELRGANTTVKFLALTSDGRAVVAGSWDKAACVWDARTGEKLRLLGGRQQEAHCFAVSPDGKSLAAACDDGRLRLYELATGNEVLQLPATGQRTQCLAFAPGGKLLASAGTIPEGQHWFGHIDLWALPTGKRVAQVSQCSARAMSFSPDGATLATANADGTMRLWEARTGKPRRPDGGHRGIVLGLAFAPDGHTLVSESYDQTLRWWDLKAGHQVRQAEGFPPSLHACVAFAPHGGVLAHARGGDYTICLREADSGKELRTLRGHRGEIYAVAFSPDGRRLVSAERDGEAIVWDVAEGRQVRKVRHRFQGGECVALSPGGEVWAVVRQSYSAPSPGPHDIDLWEPATGRLLRTFQLTQNQAPARLAFTPDRKALVVGAHGGNVCVFDTGTGKERLRWRAHESSVATLVVSPNGKTVATGGHARSGSEISLWDLATGKQLGRFPANGYQAYSLTFSPDGAVLASGGADTTILLWDLTRLRP